LSVKDIISETRCKIERLRVYDTMYHTQFMKIG